ncbi:MAG: hypothetical protein LLG00_12950 [Planctomycetaceae bacterium]|nr:hypothetical protein [Planctomycetaceae bacterium]
MCCLYPLMVAAVLAATPDASQKANPPNIAASGDFRIDNAVYAADASEPPCESTTIFHRGLVYDCMKTPAETIVFGAAAGRFILLNASRKIRAELTTEEVGQFTDRLRQDARKSSDPLVKFLAKPNFQVRFDQLGNELTLTSPLLSYRLTAVTQDNQAAVDEYREFSDWYARLNTLLSPSSRPPFGRMAVNAELAQRKAIASLVELTVSSSASDGNQQNTIRSEHKLVRPLQPADLHRVATAEQQMATFERVSFDQYRKADLR